MNYDVVIIGGGAAGFFGAINIASQKSNLKIIIVEKTSRLLHKVKISGGGRCNVTHACFDIRELAGKYPRGNKELLSAFNNFSTNDIIQWFKERNIHLKIEPDGRMFPDTDTSQTIIDCFLEETQKLNIKIILEHEVSEIKKDGNNFILTLHTDIINSKYTILNTKKVLITTGGSSKITNYDFITKMGHTIIDPLPSLFTFNLKNNSITKLMGLSVSYAKIKILQCKYVEEGPLLITHWGLSGPAIIKLSAWVARELYSIDYNYTIIINWVPKLKHQEIIDFLIDGKNRLGKKKVTSVCLFDVPKRLWCYIVEYSEISLEKQWLDLSQKEINRLTENLSNMKLEAFGKTTYKDEFVTSGGVDLKEINFKKMESKICEGIYFAGEVLNIDAITGGFNFQNAWTTSYIAAQAIIEEIGD